MDGTGGPQGQKNVLGDPIASCSHDPMTGFSAMAVVIQGRLIWDAYCLCCDDGRFSNLQ